MEIKKLSNIFEVRKLTTEDVEIVYEVSCKNKIFYQHHSPFVTKESIMDDMKALPPGKGYDDKFYVGFFEKESLVAIMDLILDFPAEKIAYIGLFMVNVEYQKNGIGSKIIIECRNYLQTLGYKKIRLGVDKENPQSNAFWRKNGFIPIDEDEYICMELVM